MMVPAEVLEVGKCFLSLSQAPELCSNRRHIVRLNDVLACGSLQDRNEGPIWLVPAKPQRPTKPFAPYSPWSCLLNNRIVLAMLQ
mmetsp:Transcript_127485/g.254715  ORF Transcript_127485/g.254715 Transcript_127485/m.254715 type:complete len:85 (-) Transcript_127485:321-575(-)